MKISKKVLALVVMTTTIACTVVGCNSNDNKDKNTTKVEENKSAAKPEKIDIKEKIKAEVESKIPEEYKGKSYRVEVGTHPPHEDFNIHIKVENDKLKSKNECKKFTADLAKKIRNIKDIRDINITFVANSKVTNMVGIDFWYEDKFKENLVDTLDFGLNPE